jgi:hypothetical protein
MVSVRGAFGQAGTASQIVPMMFGHSKKMFSCGSSSSTVSLAAATWAVPLPFTLGATSLSCPLGSGEAAVPWRRFFAPAIVVYLGNCAIIQRCREILALSTWSG